MALAFGLPTTFTALLNAIEKRIAVGMTMPRDAVFSSLASDEDLVVDPPRDRFVVIRPNEFPVDMPSTASGGRTLTGYNATWDIVLFVRLNNDQEFRNPSLLKTDPGGIFALVLSMVDSGQMFVPLADDGTTCVLREPGRMLGWRLPTRTMRGSKSPWFVVPSRWELKFNLAISTEAYVQD